MDVTKLRDWSYVLRVSRRDIIIAGHDHAPQAPTAEPRRPNWDRVGTAKAAVDFLREFMGVRFLYPELPGYTPVSGAARIDLRNSPAIEFLPMKSITVPDSLDVTKVPLLRVNSSHPAGGSFYDLAHNRFPRVDEQFGGHTWERAVPADLFVEHPEYFALIGDSRLQPVSGGAQYCLSNPDVQERIYRDLAVTLIAASKASIWVNRTASVSVSVRSAKRSTAPAKTGRRRSGSSTARSLKSWKTHILVGRSP